MRRGNCAFRGREDGLSPGGPEGGRLRHVYATTTYFYSSAYGCPKSDERCWVRATLCGFCPVSSRVSYPYRRSLRPRSEGDRSQWQWHNAGAQDADGGKSWAVLLFHHQFGQQNARPGWIDLDLFAQFADDDAQVMCVIDVRTTPNLVHDLLTRDHLAGVLRENLQHQIFLWTEDKLFAINRPGAGGQIDFKRADSDDGVVRRGGGDAGPQRRARPRDQLADTERFDDVVIRAEFEQPDFLALTRAYRKYDDRGVRPCSQPLDDRGAIPIRQTEIENNEVGW